MTIFSSLSALSYAPHTDLKSAHKSDPFQISHRLFSLPPSQRLVYTSLHQAVLSGRVQQVHLLVTKCAANVNSRDLFGRTPLMLCAFIENIPAAEKMLSILMRHHANPALRDNLGRTALSYACIQNRESIVSGILNGECSDFSLPDNDMNTSLHHAAIQGNPRIVQILVQLFVQCGSNVDVKNCLGYSPLLLACRHGNYKAALLLFKEGNASINQRDNEECLTPEEWLLRSLYESSGTAQSLNQGNIKSSGCTLSNYYKQMRRPYQSAHSMSPAYQDYASLQGFPQIPAVTHCGDFSTNNKSKSGIQFTDSPKGPWSSSLLPETRPKSNFSTTISFFDGLNGTDNSILKMTEKQAARYLRNQLHKPPSTPKPQTPLIDANQISSPAPKSRAVSIASELISAARDRSKTAGQSCYSQMMGDNDEPIKNYQLFGGRPRTVSSATESLRHLLSIYSDSVNAPQHVNICFRQASTVTINVKDMGDDRKTTKGDDSQTDMSETGGLQLRKNTFKKVSGATVAALSMKKK